jgi:hypothetical protein
MSLLTCLPYTTQNDENSTLLGVRTAAAAAAAKAQPQKCFPEGQTNDLTF